MIRQFRNISFHLVPLEKVIFKSFSEGKRLMVSTSLKPPLAFASKGWSLTNYHIPQKFHIPLVSSLCAYAEQRPLSACKEE